MYVSAYMYVCALFSCLETIEARSRCTGIWKPPCVPVAHEGQNNLLDPLEVVVSHHVSTGGPRQEQPLS